MQGNADHITQIRTLFTQCYTPKKRDANSHDKITNWSDLNKNYKEFLYPLHATLFSYNP